MTDRTPSRRKRVARRAVTAVAGVVLLLGWYVAAWVLLPQIAYRGWTDYTTVSMLEETVFAPITVYSEEEWPGSDWLHAIWFYANRQWIEDDFAPPIRFDVSDSED